MSDSRLDHIDAALAILLERTAPTPTWGRWLPLDVAERYPGLSTRSLRRLISNGTLTPQGLVPGRVLLDRLELDAAIGGSAWSKPRRSAAAK